MPAFNAPRHPAFCAYQGECAEPTATEVAGLARIMPDAVLYEAFYRATRAVVSIARSRRIGNDMSYVLPRRMAELAEVDTIVAAVEAAA